MYLLSSSEIVEYFNEFGRLCLKSVTQISDLHDLKKILNKTIEGIEAGRFTTAEPSQFVSDLRNKSKSAGKRIGADVVGKTHLC